VNGRPTRAPGRPDSNHNRSPAMAPHGPYPCRGEDNWVVIACRNDDDWAAAACVIDEDWAREARWTSLSGRLADEPELDRLIGEWTSTRGRADVASALRGAGVPAAPVAQPGERIDADRDTHDWGLWPMVDHAAMGAVRVDGQPVHFEKTDWEIDAAAPVLGQHNDYVFGELLGLSDREIAVLAAEKVI
jgi:benzylsuccinate CoA-transferase BbsF subunit